jgi:hypothetical protein
MAELKSSPAGMSTTEPGFSMEDKEGVSPAMMGSEAPSETWNIRAMTAILVSSAAWGLVLVV